MGGKPAAGTGKRMIAAAPGAPPRPRLPHVVIGGAPRSGTTFLCEVLDKHPGAFVAKPFIPERKVLMVPHADGDAGFVATYDNLFASAPADAVLVEKTSYYLENEDARARFARVLPETRIVFILRDPIRRAYSNWLWSKKNGLETLPFPDAIGAEGSRANPLPPERAYARPFDYLTRGFYGRYVAAWIDAIGEKRVAVFGFEEAMAAPVPFAERLQRFAGLDVLPWSALHTGAVNALDDYEFDLPDSLVADLRRRLALDMALLARLTGLDVGRWGFAA
ncbi:MAG: sulfotransferase [Hyphomicrobiaceae bacterium]|nr:sulfotransferase [Hyphomicrobiaceae bacterium]